MIKTNKIQVHNCNIGDAYVDIRSKLCLLYDYIGYLLKYTRNLKPSFLLFIERVTISIHFRWCKILRKTRIHLTATMTTIPYQKVSDSLFCVRKVWIIRNDVQNWKLLFFLYIQFSENECHTPSKEHYGNEVSLNKQNLSLKCFQSLDQ